MRQSTRKFEGRPAFAPAWKGAIVALAVAVGAVFASASQAAAETRTLKLYFIHTKERAEITFKKNGRYVQSGLNEINRFLRDWRRNEPAKMDPRLLDLVWEVYRNVGARDYIHVVSAYRSPATNKALRSRSSGVAENSQHMLGKAMDFYIPGVPLAKLRQTAFKAQVGGVGFYPKSGSPFVHLDVGNVRSWPRMSRSELMALFPDGKTIHIPADGKPLPGFNQALAEYKSKGRVGASVQMASARSEPDEKRQGFFARLFGAGGGADEEEDSADAAGVQVAAAAPAPRRAQPTAPVAAAAAAPVQVGAQAGALPGVNGAAPLAAAPVPPAPLASEPEPETPETILARLPARSVPVPVWAARPSVDVGPAAVAAAAAPAPAPAGSVALAEVLMGASAPAAAEAQPGEVQLAMVAPRPTRRPDLAPPAEAAPMVVAAAPAVAARTATTAADIIAGVAGQQPAAEASPSATLAAFLPLPAGRPSEDAVLAALPRPAAAARAETQNKVDERLARLAAAPAASPRLAVIGREKGTAAAEAAVASGVRTTGKGAKPVATDSRPDPKAVAIPVPTQVARWALSNAEIRMDPRGATPPSFAHAIVRSAPEVVYTDGFHNADVQAGANRFTGKAVSFMSVARFGTN